MLKSILADIPPILPSTPSSTDLSTNNTLDNKAQQEQKNANDQKLAEFQKFINTTPLQINIQEIIGQYSVLENYFMTENINKAIQMDTVNRNSLTSSVVDDTFFIIKKCIK